MSIASEITRINNNIASAYTACNGKGATMPATQNSANLATTISSIQTGGGGVGITREVSATGVYQMPASSFTFSLPSNATDVGDYALYYAFYNCASLTSADLSSLTTISGNYALGGAFRNCTSLTSVDLSSLTTISGNYAFNNAFYGCTGITSVDLSGLTTVNSNYAFNNAFRDCTGITSVDLSGLTTVNSNYAFNNAFYGCTGVTDIDFSNLTTVTGANTFDSAFLGITCSIDFPNLTKISGTQAFHYAFGHSSTTPSYITFPSLTQIGEDSSSADYGQFYGSLRASSTVFSQNSFPNLEKIYCTGTSSNYGTFQNLEYQTSLYFPKLDTITYGTGASSTNQNACNNIFKNCLRLTALHFGAANQAAIEASPGYSTAWGRGAGNVTIYFDL